VAIGGATDGQPGEHLEEASRAQDAALEDVLAEVKGFFEVHKALGTQPAAFMSS